MLITIWNGCEENFLNSVSKQSQLKIALEKPHQDLGPQIADRVKGFANHLMVHLYSSNIEYLVVKFSHRLFTIFLGYHR